MGQIINFIEARDALVVNRIKQRLQQADEERQERMPKKKAVVISALPGEPVPAEYQDLRPFLQRDGLVLLSWAVWNDHKEYGPCYRVNWGKSCGKHSRYCSSFTDEAFLSEVMPVRNGDFNWREGIAGTSAWNYSEKDIADIVFLAAPKLTGREIPSFVRLLKAAGVTVDFDYDFSLGKAKEIEFRRFEAEITALAEKLHEGVPV